MRLFSVSQTACEAQQELWTLSQMYIGYKWCNRSVKITSGISGTQQFISEGNGWMEKTCVYSWQIKTEYTARENNQNPNFPNEFNIRFRKDAVTSCPCPAVRKELLHQRAFLNISNPAVVFIKDLQHIIRDEFCTLKHHQGCNWPLCSSKN